MRIYESKSGRDTYETGIKIGKTLKGGDVVALFGELGTGKTVMAKGIARGAGINDHITSPTYTFVNEHHNGIKFYHFDMYRINNENEAEDIGVQEYFSKDSISVIEWADRIEKLLPENRMEIWIEKDISIGPEYRKIRIMEKK